MRATIDWSVEPAPRRAARPARGPRRLRDAVHPRGGRGARRGPLVGRARRSTASRHSSTPRWSSRPRSTGASVFSLLAIVREYAIGRLKERGDADVVRAAHADYYRDLVARVAPHLRGAGQADAVAAARPGAAEPSRGGAPPRLHRPPRRRRRLRMEPAHLLVDRRASSPRCGCGCWSCSARSSRSRSTRAPSRGSSRCGARCGSVRPTGSSRGSAECVRLFAESGDEDAAAMALAARATARLQLPMPDVKTAGRELADAVERLRAARQHAGPRRSPRSRAAGWRGCSAQPDEALAHFNRATEVAEASGDLFTALGRGQPPGAPAARRAARWMPPRRRASAPCSSRSACTTRRASPTASKGSAPSPRRAATASARARCRRRPRSSAIASASSTPRRSAVHTPQLDAIRAARPRGGRRRRAARRRAHRRRGDRARAARCRTRRPARVARASGDARDERAVAPPIRTPDQRLRVFVSSTLRELADERRAARAAIERLHLAPVMFELGARPHPPRALYRSYLAQSRRVRRHLRRQLRLGRARRGGLRPRGRVQPRPGIHAEAHLHQGVRAPRRSARRADRPHPLRRHGRLPPVRDRRASSRSSSPATSPRSSPSASTQSRAPARRPQPARGVRPSRAARRRTPDHRPRGRPRASARAARAGRRPGREPGRPRRHRQEPPRHRGRPRDRGPLPRRHVLRAPRGRARARPAAPDDRLLPRRPRQRRCRARGAHRARARRQARADRPRQLRADRGCRARARAPVQPGAARDVPRHEPDRAADPRRARVRGRARCRARRPAARDASTARCAPPRSRCSSTGPGR